MILVCSSEGRQFTSKVQAFEHIISMGDFYDKLEVDTMMRNLRQNDIKRILNRFDSLVDE